MRTLAKPIFELAYFIVLGRDDFNALLVDDGPIAVHLHHGHAMFVFTSFFIKTIVKTSLLGDIIELVIVVTHQAPAIGEVEELVDARFNDEISFVVNQARSSFVAS